MKTIPLDRRFTHWNEQHEADMETLRLLSRGSFGVGWSDILKAKRVVVLAEGGSGKSTEFEAQHKTLTENGEFSFLATVKKVGEQDFESALTRKERERLTQWISSDKPAWFFVDSVDEAKLALVQFEDALRHIAESIQGGEGRAHIIISGRHADWEFQRDLASLNEILPVHEMSAEPSGTPNELVIRAMRREKAPAASLEQPMILLMSPLDPHQVERFATAKGTPNVQTFLADIEEAGLWRFASRPADLEGLMRYWVSNRAFNKLEPMLSLNLEDRFNEVKRVRQDKMSLDLRHAMRALDRVGAAMTLGKKRDVLITDNDRTPGADADAMSIAKALPDFKQGQHLDLINSALFVPAAPGRARLHNDAEGAVRSYLAARWIKRLSEGNCPRSQRSELLFATTYGVDVIKPSMRETAAWLSIWDEGVAQETLRRDPIALIELGDPASLSSHTRIKALDGAITIWADRPHTGFLSHESLRRFAQQDIGPAIKEHWQKGSGNEAVRHLLLLLVEAGRLSDCPDIALAAATDLAVDETSQAIAARALGVTGSPGAMLDYRDFLLANKAELHHETLWTAVDVFFPKILSVGDLIALMDDLTRPEFLQATGIDFYGPKLAERIDNATDALALIRHLRSMAPENPVDAPDADLEQIEARFSTMRALAFRLLDLGQPSLTPEILDLQLWFDRIELHRGARGIGELDLRERLSQSPQMKQAWFWSAVAKYLPPEPSNVSLQGVWQLAEWGYRSNFELTDIEWLMADITNRSTLHDKALALDGLLAVWSFNGRSAELLSRISDAANGVPELKGKIQAWLEPVHPSASILKLKERHQEQKEAADRERATLEKSWTDFADRIRAEPTRVEDLLAPSEDGVDSRMHFLWNVLRGRSEDTSGGGIPDLGTLRGAFDDRVIELFRAGLLVHWRLAPMPTLKSALPPEQRNNFTAQDMMGLDGVSLESRGNSRWAESLCGDEARRASIYATFALNRLPHWFSDLCAAHPDVCADTLRQHLAPEIADTTGTQRRDILERLSSSDEHVARLIEPALASLIIQTPELPLPILGPVLRILRKSNKEPAALLQLAVKEAEALNDPTLIAEYLGLAFSINGDTAIGALSAASAKLGPAQTKTLASALTPKIFGNRWGVASSGLSVMSVANLERLILFAFESIPPSEDVNRADGKAYSPDERDYATGARETAFERLANMPGAAAYAALQRFIARTDFPYPAWHLEELAQARAALDSESGPWEPVDVVEFESSFLAQPRTAQDLQRVAMNRIADLEHHLIHSDFGPGEIFALLPDEVDVQRWVADYFRSGQGKGFSIEREPHVADEKEPDLRIEAKATDARLPIEIKVAETWSRTKLEEALTVQLQGRYLRDPQSRWGILLLVHQDERSKGWEKPDGSGHFDFPGVVEHLSKMAEAIASSDAQAAQMRISVIDVSKVPRKPAKKTT